MNYEEIERSEFEKVKAQVLKNEMKLAGVFNKQKVIEDKLDKLEKKLRKSKVNY
jgi:hypothetical protein